ncbi:ppfA [Escherichia coli]|uniref:ppfA n=1 Tax=Escherichia coli TaxID=562 RepID=UPI0024E16786|nr:ppfA [Escherichia coli]
MRRGQWYRLVFQFPIRGQWYRLVFQFPIRERDKSIMDLNQTIETMNKAEQHFHSQEVKNESEQAKYADRQMERKAEVQKQLVAAGNVRQRIPADTQRLLRESISEFNADADKG